ncbi:MAG: patatin-like phospholipase family protein [Collinsella sp.]
MTAEDKAKNAGKVALVLEGGSFRGQFTAGVLDVLMEAGVEIPAVYGVSAGALNGVNYKSHQIGRANRINLAFCNDNRFMGAASFAATGSIVGYDFIFNDVQDRLDPLTTRRSMRAPSRCTPSRRTCSLEPPRTSRSKAPCSTSTPCAHRRRCRW